METIAWMMALRMLRHGSTVGITSGNGFMSWTLCLQPGGLDGKNGRPWDPDTGLLCIPTVFINAFSNKSHYMSKSKIVRIEEVFGAKVHPSTSATQGMIGIDWFPAMNTDIRYYGPKREVRVGPSSAGTMPESFTWADSTDVVQKRMPGKTVPRTGFIGPVTNQGSCGCCWAMCTTNTFADRTAIATLTPPVVFSTAATMACSDVSNPCDGAHPLDAAKALEQSGTTLEQCLPYDGEPSMSCEDLQSGCKTGFIKAGPGSKQLSGQDSVKEEIFKNGPVIAALVVWGDFLANAQTSNWAKTSNIYINTQSQPSPYLSSLRSFAERSLKLAPTAANGVNTSCQGLHVIELIGWGVQDNVPGFGRVAFWHAKNTWGSEFGSGGLFKIAMPDSSRDINTRLGLDTIIKCGGSVCSSHCGDTPYDLGGVTVVYSASSPPKPEPTPEPKPEPTPEPRPTPDPVPKPSPSPNKSAWYHVAVFIQRYRGWMVGVLILLGLLLLAYFSSRMFKTPVVDTGVPRGMVCIPASEYQASLQASLQAGAKQGFFLPKA